MRYIPEKLLAIMLAILLGAAPMQGAMAEFSTFPKQSGDAHLPAGAQIDVDHGYDHTTHNCDQYNTDTDSTNHDCSSGQCVSCAPATSQVSVFSTIHTSNSLPTLVGEHFISRSLTSLYRPPRS